ncbi:MAG: hypothetical protein DRO39_00905 [Thermoprotei archaeon]|nr:MAG: hypothetical protein DRO39_00905 [Thermoprotei archaeon]
MMPIEDIRNIGDNEDLLRATLMTLMHNHLEHIYDLFRPIPEDARAIERLEENPPALKASGYGSGYRIYRKNGELILRTLNTLQMCLSRIQARSPDARLAMGLVYNIRSRLVRPVADEDYFYVKGSYEGVCEDIALLQDVVACSISEAVEDDSWVISEKLYILFGTACPVCHRVFSSEGWREFEKALDTRRRMSMARKTRYGIPFMYRYIGVDVQNNSQRFFSYLSVVAGGLNLPVLIYYNPISLKLIIWHSTFISKEAQSQVKDTGPFTRVLFNLPVYFVPSKELPSPYDELFGSMHPSWKFVYRLLFEEKPIERAVVRGTVAVPRPQQKKSSTITVPKQLGLISTTLYPTYRDYRRDLYLTHVCDILFTSMEPMTSYAISRLLAERVSKPIPSSSTIDDMIRAYEGELFRVEKRGRKRLVSLTEKAEELMKMIISGKFKTIAQAYMAVYKKNILTMYYDLLKAKKRRRKTAEAKSS